MVVLNAGESKMKMGTPGYTVAPTCSHTVRKIKESCNKRNVQKSRRGINHQKNPTLDLTDIANVHRAPESGENASDALRDLWKVTHTTMRRMRKGQTQTPNSHYSSVMGYT